MFLDSLRATTELLNSCLTMRNEEFESFIVINITKDLKPIRQLANVSEALLVEKLDFFIPKIKESETTSAMDLLLSKILGVSEATAEKLIFCYSTLNYLRHEKTPDSLDKLETLTKYINHHSVSSAYERAKALR
jgi:hypothetical protein